MIRTLLPETIVFERQLPLDDPRDCGGCTGCHPVPCVPVVYMRWPDGYTEEIPHIVHHSPTGMEWGYGGSGPADCARSILIELTGQDGFYQEFKWNFIAKIPFEGGELEVAEILAWVTMQRQNLELPLDLPDLAGRNVERLVGAGHVSTA